MKRGTIEKAAYGALTGMLLIHAFLFWHDRSLLAKGYPDFTIFYSAGLTVRQGLGHRLYDDATQYRIQQGFAPHVEIRQGALPYMHPPFEALLFAPLTLLSYPVAFAVWDLLSVGMLALVPLLLSSSIPILRSRSAAFWMLASLAFFPVFMGLLQGQDVILLLLLNSLAFAALSRGSNFVSGCWLGLGSFKIHLVFPLVLIIALGWKRPKVFLGFLAICLCLGAISVAIVGWPQAISYPWYLFHLERVGANGAIMAAIVPNLRGLFEGWRMPEGYDSAIRALTLCLSLALLAWTIVTSRKQSGRSIDLHFAMATTVGLLISYHAFASDLVLLLIPFFVVLNRSVLQIRFPRDLTFVMPVVLLLFLPTFALLLFRFTHLNLVAFVLLLWVWGIQVQIKAESQSSAADPPSRKTLG